MPGAIELVPLRGYLERLRGICDAHGILLIFDEVITAFGRLGTASAAEYFGVTPDLMTFVKAVSNGAVPLGGVVASARVHEAIVDGAPDGQIEFAHGYTYSAHPLACAAALATLDLYAEDGLFDRAAALAPYWEAALHGLRGACHVVDIRNLGVIGAVELAPRAGRRVRAATTCCAPASPPGCWSRVTGDVVALSPPLVIEEGQMTGWSASCARPWTG